MITGGQIGDDKFLFFISAADTGELPLLMRVACELHATGLTLPFDFTSVPHKSGKATALLVDYPSNSQMPSNDYLAMRCSRVGLHRYLRLVPVGFTLKFKWSLLLFISNFHFVFFSTLFYRQNCLNSSLR